MGLVQVIKYKKNDEASDLDLMRIIGIVIISIVVILIFQSLIISFVITIIAVIAIYFFFIPDGQIEIHFYDEKFFIKNIKKEKSEFQEVENIKYRWSYNYVPTIEGLIKANDFTIIRIEILTKEGDCLTICRELNLWESIPSGWNYHLINKNQYGKYLITSTNLFKLKTELESLIQN